MSIPNELKYSKTHEWVRFTSDTECEVGLTDHAQSALGDLVFVNLPEVDAVATKDEAICDVESVKAVSDVNAPVSGKVTEINEELADEPAKINEDPYGSWLFKLSDISDVDGLMNAEEDDTFCQSEE